ncbi:AbfB domain-containing protein [Streptomyces erythrochromogenes]|uniref:AbfB domain-containing protein n=1 Tax=Streptomyces erythrochromogenes TaxID=285574 RepID=UPI0036981693
MMARISLFSNNLPDSFIVERNGFGDIAEIVTDTDRGDATFDWTGSSMAFGKTGQLRRAVAPIGFVLHIATFDNFRIHGKFFDGIIDPEVKARVLEESTFLLEKGLIDPNHFSFRSTKFPELFIRHRDSMLFAEKVETPDDFQSATFRRALPHVPQG